ncbi:hypothetical protein JEZ13_05895 [bacterium]|nr:hypothetical protein [bacterium]
MKKIAILTRDGEFYGQTRKPWVSADIKKIEKLIREGGYEPLILTYHQVFNNDLDLTDIPIFYTFSQKENLRHYIGDIIHYLYMKDYHLIPELPLLLCHEDKGYQEILKKKREIKSLNSLYFSSSSDISKYDITYPGVLKTIDGSNGNGVFLVKSQAQLLNILKKWEKISFLERLDLLRRAHLRVKKFKEYPDFNSRIDALQFEKHIKPERSFILQPFIPNLKYDYRVLVLYDQLWVTRRWNRDNDFRASGAKKFDCNFTADPKLLDFAMTIFKKFDTPSLSIDIAFDGKDYHLIEFQAQHFGVNVIVKNKGFYYSDNKKWLFKEVKPDVEEAIAHCVVAYLDKNWEGGVRVP